MFDIGWSELVVIGVVALLVVGPKELPALLRTIGRYVGMIRRQANEFRAQFDEAMRETELEQLRKEVASLKSEAESTLRNAEQSVQSEIASAKSELDSAAAAAKVEVKPVDAGSLAAPAASTDDTNPAASDGKPAAGSVNGSGGNGFNGAAVEHRVVETDQTAKSGT